MPFSRTWTSSACVCGGEGKGGEGRQLGKEGKDILGKHITIPIDFHMLFIRRPYMGFRRGASGGKVGGAVLGLPLYEYFHSSNSPHFEALFQRIKRMFNIAFQIIHFIILKRYLFSTFLVFKAWPRRYSNSIPSSGNDIFKPSVENKILNRQGINSYSIRCLVWRVILHIAFAIYFLQTCVIASFPVLLNTRLTQTRFRYCLIANFTAFILFVCFPSIIHQDIRSSASFSILPHRQLYRIYFCLFVFLQSFIKIFVLLHRPTTITISYDSIHFHRLILSLTHSLIRQGTRTSGRQTIYSPTPPHNAHIHKHTHLLLQLTFAVFLILA